MFVPARDSPSILHADLDAFFASVEQRDDPALRGRPVIVGIGVVMCASYEARAFGIRSAMGGVEARRRCPDAVFVPPRLDAYTEASRAVFAVFDDTTPEVEGISVDEAFLDVGGLRRISGEPGEIAARLRHEVRDRVDLPITVGAATTKHVAKVASRAAKPDGILVIPAGEELAFLHPLPVQALWGVGPATTAKLHARGLRTVGDVAQLDEGSLTAMLGRAAGHSVHALANDRDPRRVRPRQRRRSIGSQRAMGWRPKTAADIEAALMGLVDRVGRRLRSADRVGRTVVLRLRFEDWGRVTRSHTLARPTANTALLLEAARHLLAEAEPLIRERGCTLVGITVANLDDAAAVQLMLPFDGWAGGGLDAAIDAVRDRFGSDAIGRTALVRIGAGATVPLLPD